MDSLEQPRIPLLRVDPALAGRVMTGHLAAKPVDVRPTSTDLEAEIAGHAEGLRGRWAGLSPASIDGLTPARELYRVFRIDPTKTRPSSEALLRRVLRDRPFPRISNAVDLGNLVALRMLLPIGLYDSDRVAGDVTLRPGEVGEGYVGVRKDAVHLDGRPLLADDEGPFGNPTADSMRTSVAEATRALWMVVFAPTSFPRDELQRGLEQAAESFQRHLSVPGRRLHTAMRIDGGPAQ